jgi:hypothetical protein
MRRDCTSQRKDGQPCGGAPLRGADKCRMHLGKRTDGIKVEQAARAELARLNLPPVDDPLSLLASLAAEVVAWKDAMAGQVNALTSLRYEAEGDGEQLRAEVALWERALDRCERVLVSMARLNIDERLAKISEERAALILRIFGLVLDELGVETPQRRREALTLAREHFRRAA